jgi:hypothetical protein
MRVAGLGVSIRFIYFVEVPPLEATQEQAGRRPWRACQHALRAAWRAIAGQISRCVSKKAKIIPTPTLLAAAHLQTALHACGMFRDAAGAKLVTGAEAQLQVRG